MSTLRFILREDRDSKNGEFPIQGVYQISSERKYLKTGKTLRPENWDAKVDKAYARNGIQQRAIYLDKTNAKKLLPGVKYDLLPSLEEIDEINNHLSSIKKKIEAIETAFEKDNIQYSTEMVVAKMTEEPKATKKSSPINTLFEFMDKYLDENKNIRKKGSLSVYRSLQSHLAGYQKTKGLKFKITFENTNKTFFKDFQKYLMELTKPNGDIKLNNITVRKQMTTLKTFINYALEDEEITIKINEDYKKFKPIDKPKKLEVIALTEEEFQKLYTMDLSWSKKYEQVRDVFCFSCATGLRYSDLKKLSREDINIKEDEINIEVTKTGELLTIPLNAVSATILAKYKDAYKPLPVISNQKFNAFLKGYTDKRTGKYIPGLGEIAKIDESTPITRKYGKDSKKKVFKKFQKIGVHTARKTFATLSLERGIPAELVMAIGGWENQASFSRYVNITEKRKKVVMRKAWGDVKPISNKLKAVK